MSRSNAPPTIPQAPPPLPIPPSFRSQSLSQPAFFSLDSLPPLTPSPYRKTPISDSADFSAAGGDSLRNRRTIHRRSRSDLPPAAKPEPIGDQGGLERKPEGNVGDDLFEAFLDLDGFGAVESSDHRGGEMGGGSSESEAESCANDCTVVGESAPAAKLSRHFRSISMDGAAGKFNICEKSLRVSPSPGSKRSKSSSSECESMDGTFSLGFGSVEFSGAELKKIMADRRLEEIALADPKRAKRCRFALLKSKLSSAISLIEVSGPLSSGYWLIVTLLRDLRKER